MPFFALRGAAFAGTYCRWGLVGTRNNDVENPIDRTKYHHVLQNTNKTSFKKFLHNLLVMLWSMVMSPIINGLPVRPFPMPPWTVFIACKHLPNIFIWTLPPKKWQPSSTWCIFNPKMKHRLQEITPEKHKEKLSLISVRTPDLLTLDFRRLQS